MSGLRDKVTFIGVWSLPASAISVVEHTCIRLLVQRARSSVDVFPDLASV